MQDNVPQFTIHPPLRKGLPGQVRFITHIGRGVHRDIPEEIGYKYKNPTEEQSLKLTNFVISEAQRWKEQFEDVAASEGAEDNDIESEEVYIDGKVARIDYNDRHPTSAQLKYELMSMFNEYETKQFERYSPAVFDLFGFDKLNRYTIGKTEDNFIYLHTSKISDPTIKAALPALFSCFNIQNFYTSHGIRFTLIHDCIGRKKTIRWHFPLVPYIDDFKKIPFVPEVMIFEQQRTFDQRGVMVSSGVKIFADHDLIDYICEKFRLPHPLPLLENGERDRSMKPWAYNITFDDHGRVLEVAAHAKVYYTKTESLSFKSSY